MKQPGPIALRAMRDALANVGVHEVGGENAGKSVETYLASVGLGAGNPWCASFVYYREIEAAHALNSLMAPHAPQSGYVPDWKDWAVKNALWIPTAPARKTPGTIKPGDLCVYYFSAKGRVAHIGIVTSENADGSGYHSVEGNTSGGSGVERNGDGVYKKNRLWNELGLYGGFIRLPW